MGDGCVIRTFLIFYGPFGVSELHESQREAMEALLSDDGV
jgi:hypothetical protein